MSNTTKKTQAVGTDHAAMEQAFADYIDDRTDAQLVDAYLDLRGEGETMNDLLWECWNEHSVLGREGFLRAHGIFSAREQTQEEWYYIDEDGDGCYYVIPVDKAKEWNALVDEDEDFDAPAWAIPIPGGITRVVFREWQVGLMRKGDA